MREYVNYSETEHTKGRSHEVTEAQSLSGAGWIDSCPACNAGRRRSARASVALRLVAVFFVFVVSWLFFVSSCLRGFTQSEIGNGTHAAKCSRTSVKRRRCEDTREPRARFAAAIANTIDH